MPLPTLLDAPETDAAPVDAPDAATGTLPPSLRLLKWLVIALTLTMIIGVITVVTLLVTRMPTAFSAPGPALPADFTLPEGFALPQGVKAAAVTFGQGWVAVVTTDDRILIFGRDGDLRQVVDLAIGDAP